MKEHAAAGGSETVCEGWCATECMEGDGRGGKGGIKGRVAKV